MTWLDVGNGWRNLYLLSCLVQMLALGSLFAARGWFSKRSRPSCFLTGVAATPLCQYLWMLLMAAVWPHAPRLVLIGVPPAAAVVALAVVTLRRIKRLRTLGGRLWAFVRKICRFDKPTLAAACFALCIAILIMPVCVRFMSSAESVQGGDTGEYMGLALRWCEDRDLGKLLEKEETQGHFRGHNHFPSMELYMSYGLMHTGGDVGYPNDKAAFTGLGMLTFYLMAAYGALLGVFCRGKRRWICLGAVLFNLVPNLVFSLQSAPRDPWRMVALLWVILFFEGLTPEGSAKQMLGKALACFVVCFAVMSTHVVCFVVLPFIVVAWVLWRWLQSRATALRGAAAALGRSILLALAGAAGTLCAFAGNIWCYVRWGELSPWRLMTTFTDAPWYDVYMDVEYRLEETTTSLNFLEAKDSILQSYATSIGDWAMWLALAGLAVAVGYAVLSRVRMKKAADTLLIDHANGDGPTAVVLTNYGKTAEHVGQVCFLSLCTLLTLAPMTGLLDSPLYSFSGSFLKLPRYTLQWFLTGNVMICAALAALEKRLWPRLCQWAGRRMKGAAAALTNVKPLIRQLPAYVCVLLCVLGVVKGTAQTGYTNTFYRYSRHVMEDERLLLDNGLRDRYALLMDVAQAVGEDQQILISRSGYQYALRGRGYVLNANPVVPLLNLPLEEVGPALQSRNVAMIATEPDYWDERYFGLSTLDEYLDTLPQQQVIQTPTMRLYLLDAALVPVAEAAQQ